MFVKLKMQLEILNVCLPRPPKGRVENVVAPTVLSLPALVITGLAAKSRTPDMN